MVNAGVKENRGRAHRIESRDFRLRIPSGEVATSRAYCSALSMPVREMLGKLKTESKLLRRTNWALLIDNVDGLDTVEGSEGCMYMSATKALSIMTHIS